MRRHVITVLPGSLLGCTVVAELAATVLSWDRESRFDTIMYAVFGVVMVAAGTLIASRHPGNPIGWLFCGFGLLNTLASDLAQGWGLHPDLPGAVVAAWSTASSWLLSGFGWVLIFLLFPDGRPPGRWWWLVAWAGVAGLVVALPGWALSPDRGRDIPTGRNPFAVEWLPTGPMVTVGMALFVGAMLASAGSLVVRFRRSVGEERQQLKWFAAAAAAAMTILPLTFLLWYSAPLVAQVASAVALMTVPVVACVAILRYRLYDIDLIIDRTVVYGAVTVLLAAAYGLTTLLLGTTLGGGSGWITAVATLVVAVAFRPLRDRVQRTVDRRFHRAEFEAVRRMAGFLDELRAGRAAPEQVQDVLRDLTGDPWLRLLVFLPESQVYVDVDDASGESPAERLDVERAGLPLGRVLHTSAARPDVLLLRRLLETGGLAIEMTRLNAELRRQLPVQHREILLHVHLLGRGGDDTARTLGIPRGTVKSRTHHALRAMRAALGEAA